MSHETKPPDPEQLLDQHRRDVEALDRRILHLVCERLELARSIGELKGELGIPVRNFRVEAQVHSRFEEAARFLGLESGLGHDLARFLIEKAVEEQAVQRDAVRSGHALDAVVVGGRGGMGRWLCRFLAGQGHRVRVLDPSDEPCPFADADTEHITGADLVVVAVPMTVCAKVLEDLASLAPKGVVAEICSLKTHLTDAVTELRAGGLRLVSFHPMFGPDVRMLEGRTVVFCSDGQPEDVALVRGLFSETSARLVDLEPAEHDRRMGLVLGLTHLSNLVFARALAHAKLGPGELDDVASVTFAKQMATTAEVAAENPDLYFEIQALNRAVPDTGRWLSEALEEWRTAVADNDRERFVALMNETQKAVEELHAEGRRR